jgi:membrane protein YdbS with pleckstrin-like domain
MPRHTLQWSNVRTAALTLFAGLLMMATSWWFRENLMIVSILVGAVTYAAAVMLLRIVPREDLLMIRDAVMGLVGRFRGRSKEAPATTGN